MASLTLRLTKGTALTNAELDANFSNLNADAASRLLASSNLSDLANAATARTNLGLGNVENKSSATIRSELTSLNVTGALGFTPLSDAGGTVSGALTLSAGTANGVAYLNGSKVLTTGSALTFDGTTQSIFSTGNQLRLLNNAGLTERVITSVNSSGAVFSAYDTNTTFVPFVWKGFSTEYMRLTSTGLGIGTSSPTNALSVSGNANITGNTTLGDASTDTVTVNGYMGVGGAGASSRSIAIASTALVGTSQFGIVNTPTFNSQATSAAYSYFARVQTEAAAFTLPFAAAYIASTATKGAGSTITALHGLYIDDQTQGTNNFGITSLVSSGTNKWNIYASGTAANYFAGNTLVATTINTTANRLVVKANEELAKSVGLIGRNVDSKSAIYFYDSTGATLRESITGGANELLLNSPSGFVGVLTGGSERARIDSSGNLLVGGTTLGASDSGSPQINLISAVANDGQWTGRVVARNTANNTAVFLGNYRSSSVNKVPVVAAHSAALDAWVPLYVNTVDGTPNNSGNVIMGRGLAIGTTADPGAGAIYATGNITAYYSSDAKFKENVTDIPDAAATVAAIGGKLFDWTDEYIASHGGEDGYFVQKQDFGVIAQDVQKVFPRAVREREDGSLAVDYEKLSALAFAAIAEQDARIREQQARIDEQEVRIARLERLIEVRLQ